MIWNRAQIAAAWCQAGGRHSASIMAAAVALAESGGVTDAVTADGHAGLWMGTTADLIDAGINGREELLLNPTIAAREAIHRSGNGVTWSQFPGYKHGAHLQFLPDRGRIPINPPEYSGKWSGYIQIGSLYIRAEYRRLSGAAEVTFMTGRTRHYPPE